MRLRSLRSSFLRRTRCGAASCSKAFRIVCSSTAPRGTPAGTLLVPDGRPGSVVRSKVAPSASIRGGTPDRHWRRARRSRCCCAVPLPSRCPACRPFRGAPPATSPTTGARARAPAGAALRRPRAGRRRASASTTGCWRGITMQSRAWLISTGMPETSPARRGAPRARARRRASAARLDGESPSRPAPHAASRGGQPPAGRACSSQPAPSYPVAGWLVGSAARASVVVHARELPRSRRARARVHLRRRHLPGQPVAALRSAARRAAVGALPPAARTECRAVRGVPRLSRASPSSARRPSASCAWTPTGHVETRPIKGTRPRGVGPEHDAALGQALTESAKDRAENLMIVDLMRNDLSRVCAPGTVRVPELFALEQLRHRPPPGLDRRRPARARRGRARPAARRVSRRVDHRRAQGARDGDHRRARAVASAASTAASIGYWSVTGELDTSIAIRTAVARDGRVYFNAGGGIVADSDPASRSTGRRSTRPAA